MARANHRRSPCRIPAWAPIKVSGAAVKATSAAVARLSRRTTWLITGVSTRHSSAEPERGLDPDPQDDLLDLVHVLRCGRDAACSGRLQREGGDRDDQQQAHEGGEGAVVARAEQPGGQM